MVVIPAKDEQSFLRPCLEAVLNQTRPADAVLVLLNNSCDGSLDLLKSLQSCRPSLMIAETELPGAMACAGGARRVALNLAASLVPDGVLLTTDADSIVPPDWISRNLAEIRNGADIVCGQVYIQSADKVALPITLHLHEAREAKYLTLLDEITAMLDPDRLDSWPRHQQNSGASLAMKTAAYRRAGGVPAICSGEDRALVAALRRVDARIRHAPDIQVQVSGRLLGRAQGGMASTLRRRMEAPDRLADERLESFKAGLSRIRARAAFRQLWVKGGESRILARALKLSPREVNAALASPYFGAAWEAIQKASPLLSRHPLPMAALAGQTRLARQFRDELRLRKRNFTPRAWSNVG